MTERLRIGLFVMSFPKLSETFIVTKVLKLIDAGMDVQIFSVVESDCWDKFAVLENRDDVRARIHVMPPVAPYSRVLTAGVANVMKAAVHQPRAFARYLTTTWRHRGETPLGFLKSVYERTRFVGRELDILHVEFDSQGIGIADLKDYLNCHVLLSARGTFQHSSVLERMPDAAQYLFRYADGYHFISDFTDRNTRALGLPADIPTWHIEPAIDLTLFEPGRRLPRSTDAPLRVISVGRLEWEKAYDLAIDAIAKVRDAGVSVRYDIYGDGSYRDAIRFAIRQHGLDDIVHLRGAVRREDMPAGYADADVMLHAAVAEGFCNAVIEAQAMELPVVTSDAGGLPENVADGITGFVVPRRDPGALADKLLLLARDPALRARLGRAGRNRALDRFDLDRQADAFVALYRELASRPRRE